MRQPVVAADDGAAVVVQQRLLARLAVRRRRLASMGAAARALLRATLRPRWCALSLCQRLLAIAADYCSALLRAALVAVAVAWFAVAACCSQRAALAVLENRSAFEVSKQYALFECATVAQCCYGQEQCQVNCARRATQAASQSQSCGCGASNLRRGLHSTFVICPRWLATRVRRDPVPRRAKYYLVRRRLYAPQTQLIRTQLQRDVAAHQHSC